MRGGLLTRLCAFTAASALAAAGARAQSADPRAELRRLGAALDAALRRVSQPAAIAFMGPVGTARGYHITGVGAVFVLPARALPHERHVLVMRSRQRPDAPELVAEHADAASPPGPPRDRPRAAPRQRSGDPVDRELYAIELQVETFQREAERARQEAEQALEEISRAMRVRFPEFEAPAPPPPVPAASPQPLPAPPWRFWFVGPDAEEDTRSAERVVADVKTAVTQVLEKDGASLRLVRPEEFVAVTVDFVPQLALLRASNRERTLVVRVKKKDLSERQAGRLSADELVKRIDYSEY
jgi:hypothetical protein